MIIQTEKKHILLVDDDLSVAQNLSQLLEIRGYEVRLAQTGEEALKKAGPSVDLILLDLVLPDQGGMEVCRKIKENSHTQEIPIIVLSSQVRSDDIISSLRKGADDYITKPCHSEELIARMEAVMRRSALIRKGDLRSENADEVFQELRLIIDKKLITNFFQPIYTLNPFSLLGYEALTRPKIIGLLSNPEYLFKAAIQFDCYDELERMSWTNAIRLASPHINNHRLFLNCTPHFIETADAKAIYRLFKKHSINVNNVVLELTERSAIANFKSFNAFLKSFRDFGFRFAIDDVGRGYASLEAIVETRPEIVKIDRQIIHNLHEDKYKKGIVKLISTFCKENNVYCIAEGIENKAEWETLLSFGIEAGQGYYLCQPQSGFESSSNFLTTFHI